MKHLYLLRHGKPVDWNQFSGSDDEIPLSQEGRTLLEEEANGMRKLGVEPHIILSSPLTRARQTAAIVAKCLNNASPQKSKIEIKTCDQLVPGHTVNELIRAISKYEKETALLLVGHQPLLGSLAGILITGHPHKHFEFKKGSFCLIEVDEKSDPWHGDLLWFLTPEQLALVGKE